MEWYYIVLICLGALIVLYFITTFYVYIKTFTNPKDRKMQNVENALYKSYKEYFARRKEIFDSYKKEEISIQSRDNLTLRGIYVENKIKDKIVIIFHGFKSNGDSDILLSYDFYKLGYSMIIVDQRAHGKSDGKYIGMGILTLM